MATSSGSRCYCANYYGSINCRNTVPKFGDRCKLCLALKSGASLSENLLPNDILWGIESHTHSHTHTHSHSHTRNPSQSHSHNRERPSFLTSRQHHHLSHSHQTHQHAAHEQHHQRSHLRREQPQRGGEDQGREGEAVEVEESSSGSRSSSTAEKCPRPAGTMVGSSGKRRA